ncbi:MAG: 23S rRNA (guanine(2445)-N(2))/(guanine(2069)-N(7))-methyltransferase, partial [Alphaproteobacteria bacterium]|nr:23S rRNA (guanine(2445)-N(2))/(guanine(2069)-N(7))-methyltransferase [Alphaproteobacteria bacterium]
RANGFDPSTAQYVQADCTAWLAAAAAGPERYDLIFLDPPTFSNSKRMSGVLDVQRDHAALIARCMALLQPGGLLIFSTNAQRFRLDATLAARFRVQDISAATLPPDFARHARIHRCYEVRAAAR